MEIGLLASGGCSQELPRLIPCLDGTAPLFEAGSGSMVELTLIAWLACALPMAVLIGYCVLSEER